VGALVIDKNHVVPVEWYANQQSRLRLQYILKVPRFGILTSKRNADRNETFTTTPFQVNFVATVWEDSLRRYLRIQNVDGKVLALATSADTDGPGHTLHEVKCRPFDVNRAIAGIVRHGQRRS
jgi:hypothetical protein